MVPWPTRVHNPIGISISSAVFAGLTSVIDRQTDRPTDHTTWSVTIGRVYVRSTAMRPKNGSCDIDHAHLRVDCHPNTNT